jgi:hypothetical protein
LDEASEVVHVAVGIVSRHDAREPQDLPDAEDFLEHRLQVSPRPLSAVGMEEAAATLEHQVHAVAREPERAGHEPRDGGVAIVGLVLPPPGIEAEVHHRALASLRAVPHHDDPSGIAHPGIVGGDRMELDTAVGLHTPAAKLASNALRHRLALHLDADLLPSLESAHDLHED